MTLNTHPIPASASQRDRAVEYLGWLRELAETAESTEDLVRMLVEQCGQDWRAHLVESMTDGLVLLGAEARDAADVLIAYEHPGVLVVYGAHGGGNVGIDLDDHAWRAVAYAPDPDNLDYGTVIGSMRVGWPIRSIAVVNELPRAHVAAREDGWMITLPDGAGVLITAGHVFGYAEAIDGGSCTGVLHRLPDGGGECDALACPGVA